MVLEEVAVLMFEDR